MKRKNVMAVLLLVCSPAFSAVKLSALTGEYSLADSAYALALDGSTDDGPKVATALAAIGTGKTVVLPPGKTLVTCQRIVLPAGTTLIAYGATIKRCTPPSGVTTTASVTNGATSISVSSEAAFTAGEAVAVGSGSNYTSVAIIASKSAGVLNLTSALSVTGTVSSGATVRRVGDTIDIVAPNTKVLGGTIDGNSANVPSGCRWDWCVEIHVGSDFAEIRDVHFVNVPGEAIVEGSDVQLPTNTDVTFGTTKSVVFASSAVTEGFAVGDLVALIRTDGGTAVYDHSPHRITAISTTSVDNDTITVDTPFWLQDTGGAASVTTDNVLAVIRINEGGRYLNNSFSGIDGNAMHFSASSQSLFEGNTVQQANLDSTVAHQYGYITYSCYIYNSIIRNNLLDNVTGNGIGVQGCGNTGIAILGNVIRTDYDGGKYAIDIYALDPTYVDRVVIAGNQIESSIPGGYGGFGIRLTSSANTLPTATKGDLKGANRVVITGNMFRYAGVYLSKALRVLVDGNVFDMGGDNGEIPFRIDNITGVTVSNNLFMGGYGAIDITSTQSDGLAIRGNTFAGQVAYGIGFAGTAQDAVAQGNNFTAQNGSRTSSSYVGISAVPTKTQVIANTFQVDKGSACITTYNGTLDYGAAGAGTVITANVCRRAAGTLTDSIRVPANGTQTGSVGVNVVGNFVWEAITDGGSNTVTTPANVVIP